MTAGEALQTANQLLTLLAGDELGGLDTIHHQPQFVGLELRFCDVVAPFAGVVFYRNTEVDL